MKLCRFVGKDDSTGTIRVGVVSEPGGEVIDLSAAGHSRLTDLLQRGDALAALAQPGALTSLPKFSPGAVRLASPVERQEVWAAGVTYLRSKSARMEESDFSATAYDRVYEAPRPEIFFKSLGEKVSGPGDPIGIRSDARWNVPEPELALVLNREGQVVGYTVGNDMSSRDIEGENLLYLPQAKMYRHSCALGPVIRVGATEDEARSWTISIRITRAGTEVFRGETSVAKIKRSFGELAGWLTRSQEFPHGVVLLTGTGVVPPNEFTLSAGDVVGINISGVGELENSVVVV